MTARLCKSLTQLRAEINTTFPDRAKVSDGWIGDAAHRATPSDHNPNAAGVVTAIDITEDAERGVREIVDMTFAQIIAARDPRVKYLIHEGRILRSYPKPGIPAWTWAPYTGSNGHFVHGHISVSSVSSLYDSARPWSIHLPAAKTPNITAFRLATTRAEKRAAAEKVAANGSPKARAAALEWLDADTRRPLAAKAMLAEEVR